MEASHGDQALPELPEVPEAAQHSVQVSRSRIPLSHPRRREMSAREWCAELWIGC